MINCWVCGSKQLDLAKCSNIGAALDCEAFIITDSKFGITGKLYRCKDCGFLQCTELRNVLPFYEELQDPSYEITRVERLTQAKKILNRIKKYKTHGKLLDVGAGSGILVEQANKMGYSAEGIEPSKWLRAKAREHGLAIHLGILPHPELTGPYDVVTIIDVIEHVSDPVNLLTNVYNVIDRNGFVIVTTPDVDSFFARMLGWKWWHFRIAHIGYYNRNTLKMVFKKTGFRLICMFRPRWYFTADYVLSRVNIYLPRIMRIPVYSFLRKITLPLNFGDSILGVFAPFDKDQQ